MEELNSIRKLIAERKKLVKLRLEALEIEREELSGEFQELDALEKRYENKHFDSIVEERRVTESILGKTEKTEKIEKTEKKRKNKKSTRTYKKRSVRIDGGKYKDGIYTILEDEKGNGLTNQEITDKMTWLLGEKIGSGNIYNYVAKEVKLGNIIRDDKTKKYYLAKKEDTVVKDEQREHTE